MKNPELIIWVNDNDEEIGYGEKIETHVKGILHRAFSLFIYNKFDNTILIHQRAFDKYHSGGLWTNACCSHPRYGEDILQAVERRMYEELGIYTHEPLIDKDLYIIRELGSFKYYQKYSTCDEHEIDHVFSMNVNEKQPSIQFNTNEINAVKWLTMEKVENWYNTRPDDFTAWFYKAYLIFKQHIVTRGEL